MNFTKQQVVASSVNPFDNFYDDLQQIYDFEILNHLSSTLNLSITVLETPLITNLQNYKKDADLWVLEQIINGSAQISSTTLIITNETSNACKYSFSINTFRPLLYYKVRSLRDNNYIYWAPFSINVWFCILLLCLTLTLVLTFILRRESKLPHKISYDVFARLIDVQEDGDESNGKELPNTSEESLLQREKWEMSEILLVCLGAFCQQGSARDPSTHAARIILLVFFLLAAISYTAYSACIISYISLLPSIEKENFLNKQNLIDKNSLVLHRTGKIKNILQSYFQNIEESSTKRGFDKALNGKAFFVGDRDITLTFLHKENYSNENKCKLGRAFLGLEYYRVFAIKKNFDKFENINISILKLMQTGLANREKKRIFNMKPPCTIEEKSRLSNFLSFSLKDVQPALTVLGLGLIAAITIFILENFFFFYW